MYVLYRRKAIPANIDQKADLLYISFLPIVDVTLPSSMQKSLKEIHSYIDIYVYTEDKSSLARRKKIWNNNIPPQNLTYTRLHRCIFLIHHEEKRVIKEKKQRNREEKKASCR